jgi:hypothetical protein
VSVAEILVVGGQRFCVEGTPREVEAKILNAARGSILEFVWLVEADTESPVALNPTHVVAVGERETQQ